MSKFIGFPSIIEATKMTPTEYNTFRGMNLKKESNEVGYMLKYKDTNHLNWVPESIFKAVYKEEK